jgi:hypothetical protein
VITKHSVPNATLVFPTAFPNGGSAPRVCDFDDMVLRLVKWHPSNHGDTATYSELAASRLGQLIEAPVVRGMVVFVDMALLPPGLIPRVKQPFHTGFTYSPGQNFSEADYAAIENRVSLPAAAAHLAWLLVGDQQGHNQYLYQLEQVLPDKTTRKMNHFMLIDQAAICGSHDWTNADLSDAARPYALPAHLKTQVLFADVEPLVEEIRKLAEDDIRACFDSLLKEWGVSPSMVDKVTDFLVKRRIHLADVLRNGLK